MTTKDGTVGRYLHWILVAFSLGAGVIHFAYAGEHFDVGWLHGTFFAVVAWFQLSWAIVLMVRSSRAVLALGGIVHALALRKWLMSRVVPPGSRSRSSRSPWGGWPSRRSRSSRSGRPWAWRGSASAAWPWQSCRRWPSPRHSPPRTTTAARAGRAGPRT